VGILGRHAERNQVAVEARVLLTESSTGGNAQPQAVPGAVRVGSHREVASQRVNAALAQLWVPAEATGRRHREASVDRAVLTGGGHNLRAVDASVLHEQAFGMGAEQDLAAIGVADEAFAVDRRCGMSVWLPRP
jgi:hypothetical protein